MRNKLIRWLIFSVALALVPLGVGWLIQLTHNQEPTLESLLAHGELLLIAAALCAAAVGELIGSGDALLGRKLVAGGISLVLVVVAAIYFADVAASHAVQNAMVLAQEPSGFMREHLDFGVLAQASIVIYCSGFVASMSCIILSEV